MALFSVLCRNRSHRPVPTPGREFPRPTRFVCKPDDKARHRYATESGETKRFAHKGRRRRQNPDGPMRRSSPARPHAGGRLPYRLGAAPEYTGFPSPGTAFVPWRSPHKRKRTGRQVVSGSFPYLCLLGVMVRSCPYFLASNAALMTSGSAGTLVIRTPQAL